MAWTISRRVKRVHSLEEVLEISDYITVHAPLLKETKKLFDAEQLGKIKKGCVLLNFSRGERVNNKSASHCESQCDQ
ncbi:NAD(P)-dependent oxidoreductase [Carnobacterium funditum]|uniref:NAD(P)-dependent oxidoreductase n=1 Tax=Carnobacterium funditum TaxID=2752 RepID=UPI0005556351|nr:NAD(P)-dependent oxidoreductase [Carnobacterium funditum]